MAVAAASNNYSSASMRARVTCVMDVFVQRVWGEKRNFSPQRSSTNDNQTSQQHQFWLRAGLRPGCWARKFSGPVLTLCS